MATIDYEALIAERKLDETGKAQRADAARLADIAENVRTLNERAHEQQEAQREAPAATPPAANDPGAEHEPVPGDSPHVS